MFCPSCGKQLPDNANFCNGCGAKVSRPAASANSAGQASSRQPGGNAPYTTNPGFAGFSSQKSTREERKVDAAFQSASAEVGRFTQDVGAAASKGAKKVSTAASAKATSMVFPAITLGVAALMIAISLFAPMLLVSTSYTHISSGASAASSIISSLASEAGLKLGTLGSFSTSYQFWSLGSCATCMQSYASGLSALDTSLSHYVTFCQIATLLCMLANLLMVVGFVAVIVSFVLNLVGKGNKAITIAGPAFMALAVVIASIMTFAMGGITIEKQVFGSMGFGGFLLIIMAVVLVVLAFVSVAKAKSRR